ncbi:helicase associated domain-containing protein [Micromonospora sp. NPDC049257]|uniref:helicase associated domain-containing protein n=1 Tax=Micromonospora sp. NPDC049257 TaxID=3155771 RepID=UPI003444A3A6
MPTGHVIDGLDLNLWLGQQRRYHRKNTLPDNRVAALTALGIDWTARQRSYEVGFAALQHFHTTHGHIQVPYGMTVNGINLYDWLAARRTDHRLGRLNDDRTRALEALGMHWSIRDAVWHRNLATATTFTHREGHLLPRRGHREGDIDLSRWIHTQRIARRDDNLPRDKIAALDAIGMQWEIPSGWTGVHHLTANRNRRTSSDNGCPDDNEPSEPRPAPHRPGGPALRPHPHVVPGPTGHSRQSTPSTTPEGTHL